MNVKSTVVQVNILFCFLEFMMPFCGGKRGRPHKIDTCTDVRIIFGEPFRNDHQVCKWEIIIIC